MSAVAGPLHVSSLLRTMAIAPPSRDHHHAARQLASLNPRQFLANLQVAVANRSPHAIAVLKADMYELDDIFHKLSRAGHDISAAQRDFQMLQAFVSQLASASPEKQRHSSQHQHHRTPSVPSSSSPPSYSPMNSLPRSGSVSMSSGNHSPIHQGHQQQQAPKTGSPRSTPGLAPSSSTSSSSTSSSRNINSTVLSPIPHRLQKPRRVSAPAVPAASMKKVHFATHATVYTISSERGRSASTPTTPIAVIPPPRPACIPRVAGSFSADGRPRF